MGLIFGTIGKVWVWTFRAAVGYALAIYLFGWPLFSGGAWDGIAREAAACAGPSVDLCLERLDDSALGEVLDESRLLLGEGTAWALEAGRDGAFGAPVRKSAADTLDAAAIRLRQASTLLREGAGPDTAG